MATLEEKRIERVLDLHDAVQGFHTKMGVEAWWFRGQSRSHWPLLPKAGRDTHCLDNMHEGNVPADIGRFEYWRSRAVGYSKDLPTNFWEALAVAQHFGLATRLLDWTGNPLVAAYFAVQENIDSDGAIFVYSPSQFVVEANEIYDFECSGVGYAPRSISPRVVAQNSFFTIHNPPNKQLECGEAEHVAGPNLYKIVIPKELKAPLREHLADYGVHPAALYPDLEGLAGFVNWQTEGFVESRKK